MDGAVVTMDGAEVEMISVYLVMDAVQILDRVDQRRDKSSGRPVVCKKHDCI
jgi:hypothetical protein